MQNPLIVPVKVLKGHKVDGELGRLTITIFSILLLDEICTAPEMIPNPEVIPTFLRVDPEMISKE